MSIAADGVLGIWRRITVRNMRERQIAEDMLTGWLACSRLSSQRGLEEGTIP
jgi:hypothetical protein